MVHYKFMIALRFLSSAQKEIVFIFVRGNLQQTSQECCLECWWGLIEEEREFLFPGSYRIDTALSPHDSIDEVSTFFINFLVFLFYKLFLEYYLFL